jgi:pyruvate dehydrogenase E2 component (dihydrolipoamide acetyltransferase)
VATEVFLPQMGMTMEEGTIRRWLKRPGEPVREDEPLLELTTDKVDVEVNAPASGFLLATLAAEGDTLPIGTTIGWIGEPGERVPDPAPADGRSSQAEGAPAAAVRSLPTVAVQPRERVRATPLARRLGRRLGVDLGALASSGTVYRADVLAAVEQQQAPSLTASRESPIQSESTWQALSPIRRVAARRLEESVSRVPQFVLEATLDASEFAAFRRDLGASATPVIVAGVGRALAAHPEVNVNYEKRDGVPGVLRLPGASVGVAVAVDEGLLVPVVRDADTRSLPDLCVEVDRLVDAAQQGRLSPADVGSAAMTVSNLGMFGIRRFTAVINPPESCILAVGALGGEPPGFSLSLSVDHRALDGVQGARFLATLVRLLERPYRCLI